MRPQNKLLMESRCEACNTYKQEEERLTIFTARPGPSSINIFETTLNQEVTSMPQEKSSISQNLAPMATNTQLFHAREILNSIGEDD